MRKNKQPQPLLNIGTSLLLVLFLVLCLVTFAALSLSSARSDYSFSERLADRKTDYYTASNTAEEILAGLAPVIEDTYDTTASGTSSNGTASSEATSSETVTTGTSSDETVYANAESYKNALSAAVTTFFEDKAETYGSDLIYSVDTEAEQPTIFYELPVNDNQHLCVTLTTTADSYEITQWQVVNQTTDRETESLHLLPITGESN